MARENVHTGLIILNSILIHICILLKIIAYFRMIDDFFKIVTLCTYKKSLLTIFEICSMLLVFYAYKIMLKFQFLMSRI